MVQELINQIVEKTGVPADKAQQVLNVVAGFVKDKFPMMGGQIDSLLGSNATGPTTGGESNDLLGGLGSKFGL